MGLNHLSNNHILSSRYLLKKINGSEIPETDLMKIKNLLDENAVPEEKRADFENRLIKKIKALFEDPKTKAISPSFFKLFGFFKLNVVEDIFSYFIEKKINIGYLSDLVRMTANSAVVYKILNIFIENIPGYKDDKGFFEFYSESISKVPSLNEDVIRNFLFFLSIPCFLNEERIRTEMKTRADKMIALFRKNLFDKSRENTVEAVEFLLENINGKDKLTSSDEITGRVLKCDLWSYTETHSELSACINGFLEGRYDAAESQRMLYRINEISNKAFRNFDLNMNRFARTVESLSVKLYDTSGDEINALKECELIANGFEFFETDIIKNVLKKMVRFKGLPHHKDDTVRNRMLHLLIDEDLKTHEMRNDRKSESSDLNPLDDAELVYNPKNEILFYADDRKYGIRKTTSDIGGVFVLAGYEKNDNNSDIRCENEELLKLEMEKMGIEKMEIEKIITKVRTLVSDKFYKDDKSREDEAILDAALEVVNEIKSGYNREEIEINKNDIAVIAEEVLDDRKKFFNNEKSKKIISAAIDISLKEKDFEDL